MLQQGQLRLRRLELRLGAGHVLCARSQFCQTQGFLLIRQLGLDNLQMAFGAVQILRTDTTPLRVGGDALQTLQILLGLCGIDLGCSHTAPGLGDFLRPCTIAQTLQGLLLNTNLRLCLFGLQGQGAGIQHSQHDSCVHAIAFLDAQFSHTATAIEGQRNLADVHVAVQHQRIVVALVSLVHPRPSTQGQHNQENKGNERFFHDEYPERDMRGGCIAHQILN